MKNQKILYGIIGFLLGVGVIWFISNNAVNTQNYGMMRMMGFGSGITQRGSVTNSIIDSHFIEQMIPHHEDAITMAKSALDKAKNPELKQLAQDIIDSQSREIEQMKGWYKDWYGRELPIGSQVMNIHGMMGSAGMHMGMMGDKTDMARLETSLEFDKIFIEEMIPHHQMAVMMASMLKNGTQRPGMKQLADDIITAQTKEINQMRDWYKAWGLLNNGNR